MQDHELLQEFSRHASQEAFRQLVVRHIDAVYSAARRQVRDPQLADDVTQAVFIVLAKKAGQINVKIPLTGWLMKTTYFASRDVLKSEQRRKRHEQTAAAMMSETQISQAAEALSPQIDAALSRLNDYDRGAIALRYLENKTIAEVAEAMGVSSEAATKRITRALDRLRKYLTPFSAVVPIGTLLEHLPRMNAPHALIEISTAGTSAASSSAASISKGVFKMMIWSKAKAAAIVMGSLLAVSGAGVGTVALVEAQANKTAAISSPFVAKLNNGVSIELIGVSESPSKGKAWWFPDGSLLPSAPYEKVGISLSGEKDHIMRELAMRIHQSVTGSADEATIRWNVVGSVSSGSGTPLDAKNRQVKGGVQAYVVCIPEQPQGAVLHAEIAAGAWKTIFTVPIGQFGQNNGHSVFISTPFVVDKETHFIISQNGALFTNDQRMVAIDTAGKSHPLENRQTSSGDGVAAGEYSVQAPPANLKEIQFQERPFSQWIEIRNIAVDPGQETKVQMSTSDQPGGAK